MTALLEVITVGDEEVDCLHGQMFAGRHVPGHQLLQRVLLEDGEDVPVREVAVDASLEVLDVDGGGEEEDGAVDGTLADQGEAGQLQQWLHLILLTERREVEVVF